MIQRKQDTDLPLELKEFAYPSSSSKGIYKPTLAKLVGSFSMMPAKWELMSYALKQAYKEVEARQANSKRTIFSGGQPLVQLHQSYDAIVL
ncbi:hypothetical protein PVK06_043552 [Gossypium arboreum]|uniref:Uncharacterized protein n=1 Tax=Gossypium arboreum TaxID=29729 RepID=A0ABR0MNQ4_GOSAR|nr:hypothetical protein PVK06_043552 [Gossypium arboreum]